jgi:hypothetical protein
LVNRFPRAKRRPAVSRPSLFSLHGVALEEELLHESFAIEVSVAYSHMISQSSELMVIKQE